MVPKTLINWAGTLTPSPGDLPDPGIELGSPALQVDSLPPEPPGKTLNYKRRTKIKRLDFDVCLMDIGEIFMFKTYLILQ